MPKGKKSDPDFKCHFCKKVFVHEASFLKHLCEQKKRHIDRDLPHVRLGFLAYRKFFKFNYRREPDFEHFRKSRHYGVFCHFGQYMLDVRASNPMEYAQFMIEKGASVPIDRWSTDAAYETYIRHRNANESPGTAVERAVRLIEQWSVESGHALTDFFRLIPTPLAVDFIRSGKISPWMLYATRSGQDLLARFNREELNIVSTYVDPVLWKRRINYHQKELRKLQTIFNEIGF